MSVMLLYQHKYAVLENSNNGKKEVLICKSFS